MFEPVLMFCSCVAGAPAEVPADAYQPFQAAVSDAVLDESAGGAGAVLTTGDVRTLGDAHMRSGLQISGQVAQVGMDVWWGSTGASMIAANVRAQP